MIKGRTARHTISRERPARVPDGRGGTRSDFTGAASVAIPGWSLDVGASARDMANRDGALIAWTARGPFEADVARHDRVTVYGEQFQINGAVLRQPGPSARTSHTILFLEKWEG